MLSNKLTPLLLILLLTTPLTGYSASAQEMIVGSWQGVDSRGMSGGFTFHRDGTLLMVVGEEELGGSDSPVATEWQLNADEEPMHLDITYLEAASKRELDTAAMIVRFIGDDKIQLRRPDDEGNRAKAFSEVDDDYQVTMTKGK